MPIKYVVTQITKSSTTMQGKTNESECLTDKNRRLCRRIQNEKKSIDRNTSDLMRRLSKANECNY